MRNEKTIIYVILSLIGVFVVSLISIKHFSLSSKAFAGATATISVAPSTGSITVPNTFNVSVVINGGGQAFNAAQATVTVPSNLTIQNISTGTCNFTYITTPTTSDPSFAGTILGSSSTNCTVYTMTLKPTSSGIGTITFSSESVKAFSDSSEIFSSATNGSYTFTIPSPSINALPSNTYKSSITVSGINSPLITSIFINNSAANVTFPSSTTWQAVNVPLSIGSNTISVYGKDVNGNQSPIVNATIIENKQGDINGDGKIDLTDLSILAKDWHRGIAYGSSLFNSMSDQNADGNIDLTDLSLFAKSWGT